MRVRRNPTEFRNGNHDVTVNSLGRKLSKAKSAVLRVGRGGRGFVVKGRDWHKLVIAASHCLPRLPKAGCHVKPGNTEIYPNLIGPLGHKPNVWAKCLFVDPVADIAVLGSVDNQSLAEEADAYELLLEPIKPIAIAPSKKTHEFGCFRSKENGLSVRLGFTTPGWAARP